MGKFHCLLLVLKRSFICYYIICMTVPLTLSAPTSQNCLSVFDHFVGLMLKELSNIYHLQVKQEMLYRT